MIDAYMQEIDNGEKNMTAGSVKRWTVRGAVIATAIGLAGCTNPYSPGQRALGGGAIGAGTGAVIGAATGGNAAAGALIGGALGAGAGALTTPQRPRYNQGYYNGYNNGYSNGYNAPPPGYYRSPPPGY
jgi:hypothetical protein